MGARCVPFAGFHRRDIGRAQRRQTAGTDNRAMPSIDARATTDQHRLVMRRADGSPIHVLVVDDEPVLAELVTIALRYEGWTVATASDGAAAIAAARAKPPDVVVLDVMLPDMS